MTTETIHETTWVSKPIDLPDYVWLELDKIVEEYYMTGRGKALYSRIKHIKGFEEPSYPNPIPKQSDTTIDYMTDPRLSPIQRDQISAVLRAKPNP